MYDDVKIMVCCHKETVLPRGKLYFPIHVGKEKSSVDLNIQPDNLINGEECDNISGLNGFYCEMTAMYWAWKNLRKAFPNVQYIGLCHYRRYFNSHISLLKILYRNFRLKLYAIKRIILNRPLDIIINESIKRIKSVDDYDFVQDEAKLYKIIKNNDMVYTYPITYINSTVYNSFSIIGKVYIDLLTKIIKEEYPDYFETYSQIISGNRLYTANMIILKVDYLDDYCNFVFGVLKKHGEKLVEEKICFSPYEESIYARIPGYLCEILTSTYIEKTKATAKSQAVGKYFLK